MAFPRNLSANPTVATISIFGKLIGKVLEIANCNQHYRIKVTGNQIRIRESTQNPPIEKRRERFNNIINSLAAKGVFNSDDEIMHVQLADSNAEVDIPCKIISNMNIRRLLELLGVIVSAPANVDDNVWVVIPNQIKARWDRFSSEMQAHIIKCCTSNAEQGVNQILDATISKMFSESLLSPVTFDVPKIPVRLPNQRLEGGMGNELYDLTDILNIEQRNPENPFQRVNPITRDFFELKDIIPDTVAFERIQQARNRP